MELEYLDSVKLLRTDQFTFFHSEGRIIHSLVSVTIIQHFRRDSYVESEGSPLPAPTRKRLQRAARNNISEMLIYAV